MSKLGDRIRDLGKGAFGMWAFIAHGGLSKPTVRTEPLNLFRASKNMGPFSGKKKAPAATYPQAQGFQKFGPLGIQAETQGFRTAWLITSQKFP